MFFEDHEEAVYDETFNKTYHDIVEKYQQDPAYGTDDLKEFLDSMYTYAGQDWDGRGELRNIKNNAIIAALEVALEEIEVGKLTKKEPKTA